MGNELDTQSHAENILIYSWIYRFTIHAYTNVQ